MLQYATAEANEKILKYGGMRLGFEAKTIEYGREFTVSKRVCDLLEVRSNTADANILSFLFCSLNFDRFVLL